MKELLRSVAVMVLRRVLLDPELDPSLRSEIQAELDRRDARNG